MDELVLIRGMIDGPVEIEIKPYKYIRSNEQNRYYWGVVVRLISEHTGFTDNEVHEILKHIHLVKRLFIKTNSKDDNVWITRSTRDLKTSEMEEYLSKCRMWASTELGVFIPEPNEDMPEI